MKPASGYTLIELVMVMIIVGVLGAIGAGRFADSESYDRRAIAEFWLGSLRQAQQVAMARAADSQLTLQIRVDSSQWRLLITGGTGQTQVQSWPSDGLSLYQGSSGASGCRGMSVVTSSLDIGLDGDGNLASGTNLALCINTDPSTNICLASSGYAYAGICQSL
ncbi:pilus assembly FimT family protein [Parathalassolituus penaei]|uniref:Type II secretion system protein n=1 Tax=Parathalassolituus penaei TaxID=2997323 RepID=A0A9X3IRG2_9GAMM|nr:type II secretion system protein [Parathalassolituus penaei]MCY0964205.1 type II secretion system protein [Parathalassolituus penaei]